MSRVTLDGPQRRATDSGEPTNREILDQLQAFMAEHRRDHADLERRLAVSATSVAIDAANIARLQEASTELRELRDFRIQVSTIGASIKWVMGGSLLAAVASLVALAATFAHMVQP